MGRNLKELKGTVLGRTDVMEDNREIQAASCDAVVQITEMGEAVKPSNRVDLETKEIPQARAVCKLIVAVAVCMTVGIAIMASLGGFDKPPNHGDFENLGMLIFNHKTKQMSGEAVQNMLGFTKEALHSFAATKLGEMHNQNDSFMNLSFVKNSTLKILIIEGDSGRQLASNENYSAHDSNSTLIDANVMLHIEQVPTPSDNNSIVQMNDTNSDIELALRNADNSSNEISVYGCSSTTCDLVKVVDGRRVARRLCSSGFWMPSLTVKTVCDLICRWVTTMLCEQIPAVYEDVKKFVRNKVKELLCNQALSQLGGSPADGEKCSTVVDYLSGEERESAAELRQMLSDEIKRAGFPEDIEYGLIQEVESMPDVVEYMTTLNKMVSDVTETCKEKTHEVCDTVCWVIQVIVWIWQVVSCLPADAPMLTQSGLMPVAGVGLSTPVLTSGGLLANYMDPHMDFHAITLMQYLKSASGHELYLSSQHYIKANGRHMFAKDVSIGMEVEIMHVNGTSYSAQIIEKSVAFKRGLFSPFNAAGDYAIGTRGLHGGIVVSIFSEFLLEGMLPPEIIPSIYAKLFAPLALIGNYYPGWLQRFNKNMWQKSMVAAKPGKPAPAFDELGVVEIVQSAYATMWT